MSSLETSVLSKGTCAATFETVGVLWRRMGVQARGIGSGPLVYTESGEPHRDGRSDRTEPANDPMLIFLEKEIRGAYRARFG